MKLAVVISMVSIAAFALLVLISHPSHTLVPITTINPGEVYGINVSEGQTSIDTYVYIYVPADGLYMLTIRTYIDLSLHTPLPDLEIYLEIELYDDSNVVWSATLRVDEDTAWDYPGVGTYTSYLTGPKTYRLRVYSDRLYDSEGDSYIRFEWIVISLYESIDMLFIMEPGFGQTLPQYSYGCYEKHLGLGMMAPKSSYEEWFTTTSWIVLNTGDEALGFYRDIFEYKEDISCFVFEDQFYVELPAQSGKIIECDYRPEGPYFEEYWAWFDEERYIDNDQFVFLFPYEVPVNMSFCSEFCKWLSYRVRINTYSVYFQAEAHKEYLIYASSTAETSLVLCSSDKADVGALVNIVNCSDKGNSHLMQFSFECEKIAIPTIMWLKGEEAPDFDLTVCELVKVADETDFSLNVYCPIENKEDLITKFLWAKAFKTLDDFLVLIKNLSGNSIRILILSSDGQLKNEYIIDVNNAVRISLLKGDILVLQGEGKGNINISFTKNIISVNIAPEHIDITDVEKFAVNLTLVNKDVISHEINIKVVCPSFLNPLNTTEFTTVLDPFTIQNLTFYFDIAYISTASLSFQVNFDDYTMQKAVMLSWNYSLVQITSISDISFKVGHQTDLHLEIQSLLKKPCMLYLVTDIIGFGIDITGPENVVLQPGINEVEFVVFSDTPGNAKIEVNVYADAERQELIDTAIANVVIEWSKIEKMVLELFGYRISLTETRYVIKLSFTIIPFIVRISRKIREKFNLTAAVITAAAIFGIIHFLYVQFRDLLDTFIELVS